MIKRDLAFFSECRACEGKRYPKGTLFHRTTEKVYLRGGGFGIVHFIDDGRDKFVFCENDRGSRMMARWIYLKSLLGIVPTPDEA